MPRKGNTRKRVVLADPVYSNIVVTKLINQIMLDGKKGVAQKIVYGAFERISEKTGKDPVEVFETAMNNISGPAGGQAGEKTGSGASLDHQFLPCKR